MTSSNAASSDMTSGDAAWSRERVALLTALWAEGLSASLIANRLGGVSRNAVLGKIHRLRRLSGGAVFRTGRPRPAKKKRPRSGPAAKRPLRPVEGAPALRPAARESPAPSPAAKAAATAALRPPSAAEAGEPPARVTAGVTLAGLQDHMCRWPAGDPKTDGLRFCGRPKLDGLSYCARHASIAYKPARRCAQSK